MASSIPLHLSLRPLAGAGADACMGPAEAAAAGETAGAPLSFKQIYDEQLAFVWRSLRRLGVREAAVDDAVQEVFLVVHRRLPAFQGRSSVKTWVFGIVLRVAHTFRRTAQRCPEAAAPHADDGDSTAEPPSPLPDAHAERNEAVRTLHEILEEMGDDKREVFILVELEQMTAQEIAEAAGISLTNVYRRLRAARQAFDQALARRRARDEWRQR